MYTCFVAFWASAISIWAYAMLAAGTQRELGTGGAGVSLEELARHASEADCWMAIDGVVYDVTDYIPRHPTSPAVMTPWCGKDASDAYRTKGYGRPHSPAADAMLPEYRVGPLLPDG